MAGEGTMGGFHLEGFSKLAGDLIRLRVALYGPEDGRALMLRCFKASKAARISEPTVLNCWQAQDDALAAALGVDAPAERAKRNAAFLAGVR